MGVSKYYKTPRLKLGFIPAKLSRGRLPGECYKEAPGLVGFEEPAPEDISHFYYLRRFPRLELLIISWPASEHNYLVKSKGSSNVNTYSKLRKPLAYRGKVTANTQKDIRR